MRIAVKSLSILTFLFIILLQFLFPSITEGKGGDDPFLKRGQLLVHNKIHKYLSSDRFITIQDNQNQIVYQVYVHQKDSHILGFGFCKRLDSFYSLKGIWEGPRSKYQLLLNFASANLNKLISADTPFYTPILIEDEKLFLFYITEGFSLVVYDLEADKCHRVIQFNTPIIELAADGPYISFLNFIDGKYKEIKCLASAIIEGNPLNQIPIKKNSRAGNKIWRWDETPKTRGIHPVLTLDYRKFMGFGDSITEGYINSQPAPNLGYIPRLQGFIDTYLYAGEVINEGLGGRLTAKAADVFESLILKHMSKYLLLHIGTNDIIFLQTPLDSIIFNIKYMINKGLHYRVQLVLSTLIPRNTKYITPLQWQRAIEVSEYIRKQSKDLDIPYVDFWQIFYEYPEDKGGYMSLMSDHVHPGEAGYQLMAEEWLKALRGLPPATPTEISKINVTSHQATVQWAANPEPDLSHYLIEFGYSPQQLFREVIVSENWYTFIFFPLNAPFYKTIYYQIIAVDNDGNKSHPSGMHQINFQ